MKVELDLMEKRRGTMVNAAEGEQFKRKENDPSLKPNNLDRMVSRGVFTPGNNWLENIPQQYTDHGGDRGMISIAGSETPCTSLYSVNDSGVMVEELTLKKYKSSQLSVVGSSHVTEGTQNRARSSSNVMERTQIRPKSWQYLYQLSGGSRNGRTGGVSMSKDKEPVLLSGVEEVGNGFWVQTPQFIRQSNQGQAEISGHLVNKEKNMAFNNQLTLGGALKKVGPSSSFSQISASNGKEKELSSRYLEAYDNGYDVAIEDQEKEDGACVIEKSSYVSLNLREKTSDPALKSSDASLKSSAVVHDMVHDEISLRDWLTHRKCKSNKSESLNIFKQIVELVDLAHSQQVPLDVRPSCFMISPSNQVKYIGSVARRDWLDSIGNQGKPSLENHSSRKRYLEGAYTAISKNQKGSKSMKFSKPYPPVPVGYGFKSETDREVDISSRTQEYRFHTSEKIITNPTIRTQDKSGSISVSYAARQQLTSPNFQLEEKWYASPEELNDSRLTLLSNIYSLGVLLFELFCWFESSEVHTAAMLDLRHRILPPNFLSESPKEAGSCLWLLHPEPSSRPTTRVILHSELIFEYEDLSSKHHSPSSSDEDEVESDLLLHFLATLKEEKVKQASKLVEDIGCLEADFKEVEKRHLLRADGIFSEPHKKPKAAKHLYQKESLGSEALSMLSPSSSVKEGRLMRNINQLENAYFSMRSQVELSETDSSTRVDKDLLNKVQNENDEPLPKQKTINDRLGSFFDGLCKYARYDKFELRATLRSSDLLNSSNVICSLGFDRDEEYFAAAGVSKKIKIFEFNALLDDSVDIHYPVVEMPSKSKLSCVCWNNYIKNYLASTDYDGVVQLWDVNTGQGIFQYKEHEKRAWSVDFSKVDPTKLASGSDDCAVKLWTINEQKCISTIKSVANVCCVQFSGHSSHLLAFGSADYKTYCYDLRYARIPWCILAGHSKAVSYVKFLNPDTIVSASTDNTLKLWDLKKTSSDGDSTSACTLSFTGHTNEKNFVGLSVSDGYIACGSETNEVYSYYKSLPMPITSHKFGSTDPITGQETGSDVGQFVASVCWRGKSNMLVAANSIGSIKVLELV
ncbi:hypothetical protein MKW94_001573 [Papaver nudicaule]|uniref:Uncharacterized protein n=1 Tax=Papaver nudicaule TaxID=74823 RepID=A0AA41V345_PAPNU|nr:hypothetical protein [Papaver nudicaule]